MTQHKLLSSVFCFHHHVVLAEGDQRYTKETRTIIAAGARGGTTAETIVFSDAVFVKATSSSCAFPLPRFSLCLCLLVLLGLLCFHIVAQS
jgi:hypothetical protein